MRASVVIGIDRRSYLNRGRLYSWLSVLDIFFSNFVLAPFIVAFWCSTWFLIKNVHFLIPDWINSFPPLVLGFFLSILFTVFQRRIQVILTEHISNRYVYFFTSRLYTELFGIASVGSWYGVWSVIDYLIGKETETTLIIVILSYAGMIFTKTVRNITASPYAIVTDRKQGYFEVPTLFRSSYNWKKRKGLYVLDSAFSVIIVGTLVIQVWRGAWTLLDEIIYPKDYEKSGWTSLGLGYFIVFITFILQIPMKIIIRRVQGYVKLIILDLYVIFSFLGTINIWRGIWIVIDKYARLEKSPLNCIITHIISFLILVTLNSSNTLLVRGVYIDAEENDENCVDFPCYYFRLIFQEKEQEKVLADIKDLEKQDLESDGTSIKHPMVTEYIDQDSDEETVLKMDLGSDHRERDNIEVEMLKEVISTSHEKSIN